jgi:hypothetical protein
VAQGRAEQGVVDAARQATERLSDTLRQSQAFSRLPEPSRQGVLGDLAAIRRALAEPMAAVAMEEPRLYPWSRPRPSAESPADAGPMSDGGSRRPPATETVAARAGALSDEIDFPQFVGSLVHGAFDAILDASIRQMEAFADLVSAVAKDVRDFTRDNVTDSQARDWLVEKYPQDVMVSFEGGPRLMPRPSTAPAAEDGDADSGRSPAWLAEFSLEGQELTAELLEGPLLARAREQAGRTRQQLLATMVLLGMNRVIVRDGTIAARLRFRVAAADRAKVDYAVSDDPQSGGTAWGRRGSSAYQLPSTKVSTVGVNVQSDTELKAELFGEVKINFASETLPLERFVDEAKRTLLERHARPAGAAGAASVPAPSTPGPTVLPSTPPAPQVTPAAPAGGGNP